MRTYKDIWHAVEDGLRTEYGETIFRSWIKPLVPKRVEDGVLFIEAPTTFLRDWVLNNYGDSIRKHCSKADAAVMDIAIDVSTKDSVEAESHSSVAEPEKDVSSYFGAPLDPKLTFDNFVVGKPNEFAYAAAQRVAESQSATYNPLFLYGGVGLGKTHLLHAIGNYIYEFSPELKILYVTCEQFTNDYIASLYSSTKTIY